jgi:hypothetical protein
MHLQELDKKTQTKETCQSTMIKTQLLSNSFYILKMFFKRYENSLLFYFKIIFCVFYIKNYLKKLKNIILIYFQPKHTLKKNHYNI